MSIKEVTEKELVQVKRKFGILGHAKALDQALQTAIQVAQTRMSVLITGENGSGKESFAHIIHTLSEQRHGRFVAVNCGAIPEGTMDSELFGHEKGAFTSAEGQRKGYFEEACDGTIFLDEIGEMPLHVQPKLLRVLENKQFMRVGSSTAQYTNARIIAATHVNLYEEMRQRSFREDLFYRLAQVQIIVPPLRQRKEDLLLLFRKFALDFAQEYQIDPIELTPEAQEVLQAYPFPGNIRQLKNIAFQLSLLASHEQPIPADIVAQYLPPLSSKLPTRYEQEEQATPEQENKILYRVLSEMQHDIDGLKRCIKELLQDPKKGAFIREKYDQALNIHAGKQPLSKVLILPRSLESRSTASSSTKEKAEKKEKIQEKEDFSIAKKEKELIQKALKKYAKKPEAAKALGIAERTLYRKIKTYHLE